MKKYIPFILIIIILATNIYIRTIPSYLPITDGWAKANVYNFYKAQILNNINKNYPNLGDAKKTELVNEEFEKFYAENEATILQQIADASVEYKNMFKDESGQTYLIAIDPYYYLRHVNNYLDHGLAGTIRTNDISDISPQETMWPDFDFENENYDWDGQRMAPIGAMSGMTFHTYFGAYLHKMIAIFNPDQSTMATMFYVPVIIIGLAAIFAFLIGRRLAGDLGGFFAGMLLVLNINLLSRTVAGFSDTDAYTIFFPMLVLWLFIESVLADTSKKRIAYAAGAGFSVGLFLTAWIGWWYVFDFILVGSIIYLLIAFVFKLKDFKDYFLTTQVFFVASFISITIFKNALTFFEFIKGPLSFMVFKSVATKSLWPTVRTTVAELNNASFADIVASAGGTIFFTLFLFGLLITFIVSQKKRTANVPVGLMLIIWAVGSIYASLSGWRFIILFVPAFCIGFGIFMGLSHKLLTKNWPTWLKLASAVLLMMVLFFPFTKARATATGELPSMNDAWYSSLTKIKTLSNEDAIINSWWDFGHWFITIADRRVTFDGGGQDEHMAYWIGKSLLTDDEKHTIGILRMVDCGNNNAFYILNEELNDTPLTIEILDRIIMMDREDARLNLVRYIDDPEQVLRYTHCDPPQDFFITSEDMVYKSGVWAHFGSWDFERAEMYMDTKKNSGLLMTKYNLSGEEASRILGEIETTDADRWISGWPGYASPLGGCEVAEEQIVCSNQAGGEYIMFAVNRTTMETIIPTTEGNIHPYSLVYADGDKIKEKKFDDYKFPYTVAVVYNNQNVVMAPELATSTFTKLFYYRGLGQKCFDIFDSQQQFDGQKIFVWFVDWDCKEVKK